MVNGCRSLAGNGLHKISCVFNARLFANHKSWLKVKLLDNKTTQQLILCVVIKRFWAMGKHIIDIEIGDYYKHLPSGNVYKFEKEDQIAWNVINPDNYVILDKDDREYAMAKMPIGKNIDSLMNGL